MVLAVEVGREGERKIPYVKLAAGISVGTADLVVIITNVPREIFEVG